MMQMRRKHGLVTCQRLAAKDGHTGMTQVRHEAIFELASGRRMASFYGYLSKRATLKMNFLVLAS
jgi:hypothetical protein